MKVWKVGPESLHDIDEHCGVHPECIDVVTKDDAVADMDKARQEGAREEREAIIKELEIIHGKGQKTGIWNDGYMGAIFDIKSRGEQKPVKINSVITDSSMGRITNSPGYIADKLNEVIDAVNALTEKKA